VRFQIVHKTAQPGNLAVCIRPDFNIAKSSLEWRPTEPRLGHELVNCGSELDIERAVVLGQHVLSVRFFAHFNP